MTNEEAIENLKVLKEYFEEQSGGSYPLCFDNARIALEKQIPKKPTVYDSVPHGRCPSCRNAVRMYCDDPKNKYCIWCGQALDWRE